ncbi:hypothetical protein LOC67_05705 [Stieleria sp. JC731]|uniref:hypothetical protein n=1 Tax=Pirellulaceae TaxID=2691357 RepID=UPI001E3FF6A8|nr:hypothetical protein [Stieleria sp. JC731]MCC9600049.1 hypothetical protein [Stieleria sp. JC731]
MAVSPNQIDELAGEPSPGGLLGELERRQDDVLQQLDDLDAKLAEVLKGLEASKAEEEALSEGELSEIDDETTAKSTPVAETKPTTQPTPETNASDSPEDWA